MVEDRSTDEPLDERARYTASEIAEYVRAGRLFGLPIDTSAIHKLARAEGWDHIKKKIEGQKGPAAHLYQVPARYFEPAAGTDAMPRRKPRTRTAPSSEVTDRTRLLHLRAVDMIELQLPGLITRDRQRYRQVYLFVCRLLEKNFDEKVIVQAMLEMAQISNNENGNNPSGGSHKKGGI